MTDSEKRAALASALERTDSLMDGFMDVLKQDFGPKEREKRDFSQVVSRIIPEEKPAPVASEPVSAAPVKEEDDRLRMSYASLLADSSTCTRCGLCGLGHQICEGNGTGFERSSVNVSDIVTDNVHFGLVGLKTCNTRVE